MNTRVLYSIECERDRQDKQWGGSKHDDEHNRDDWFEFVQWQIDKHKSLPGMQRIEQSRYALVKIAALAVRGIESIDRKEERNGINDHK